MTQRPKIQLLVFEGCPLASAARQSLRKALAGLKLTDFEEVDLLGSSTPEDLKSWGSPTILIDGNDLVGAEKGAAIGCRVYAGPGKVPTPDEISAAVQKSFRRLGE